MSVDARPHAVLVGPPGADVTEAAAWVAEALGTDLVDTDALVAQQAGQPVAELVVEHGEIAYRELERTAALDSLTRTGVVALGGGAVVDAQVAAALDRYRTAGGRVLFLDVSLAHAVPRLGFNGPRPVGFVNPRAIWQTQMEQRRPHYAQVSTDRVSTDGRSVTEVGHEVLGIVTEAESTRSGAVGRAGEAER